MRINGFLKVPDIPGPSERDGHEDEIEVHGLTFSMTAHYDPEERARRKRASVDPVVFWKYYDVSSPYLAQALFNNTAFDEVVFAAQRTIDDERSDYLVITLTNASVTSYELQPAADRPDTIEERLAFSFQAITFNYDDAHETELTVRRTK